MPRPSPFSFLHIRRDELAEVGWSALTFFLVLSSYYILRPLRDEIGANDRENLNLMWTASCAVMLVAAPFYYWMVRKFWDRRLLSLLYRFFVSNILVFYGLMHVLPADSLVWVERVFYVWVSVFNLFVVAMFWALMADRHRSSSSKRLFGLIAVGGTMGGILGSLLAASLPQVMAPIHLLVISAAMLEVSCRTSLRIYQRMARASGAKQGDPSAPGESATDSRDGDPDDPRSRPTGMLEGLRVVVRSPYLLAICAYLFLHTLMATFLYYQQADIVRAAFSDRAARTSFFAAVDLVGNISVAVLQLTATGALLRRFGLGVALLFVPVLSAFGFGLLALAPTLWVLVGFNTLRRVGNFSFGKPARDALYTVVSRREKYQSKVFIDTAVYRGSDLANSWLYTGLGALGLGGSAIALVAVPIAGVWAVYAWLLGRRHDVLVTETEAETEAETDDESAAPGAASLPSARVHHS